MVEKIYLFDAYMKEVEAKITAAEGNVIELDKTIFYPTGGGVPFDTGRIIGENGLEYNVIETKKDGDRVLHIMDSEPMFTVGDVIIGKLDWDRRYAHMRYHTAAHVVGGVIEKRFNAMYTGGQIYHDRARFDFDISGFTREIAQEVIVESQRVTDENHDVVAKIISKEEAMQIPNLARTEPGRELLKKLDVIRVVDIVGFDLQLDGGTHVANTKEIGQLELSDFVNKGAKKKRMEIVLK